MIGKEFLVYLVKTGNINQQDLVKCVQESKTQQVALPQLLISQGYFTAEHLKELLTLFQQTQQIPSETLLPEGTQSPLMSLGGEPQIPQTVIIKPSKGSEASKTLLTPLAPISQEETTITKENQEFSFGEEKELNPAPQHYIDGETLKWKEEEVVAGTRKIIGKYEVLEELAKGGMGVVYKVRHQELNQIYALKLLLSGSLASEEDIKRFYREAQTTAKLKHPNIVQIIDVGKVENQHYICMELIEGKTLEDKFQEEKKVAIRSYLLSFKKILNALHYAHNQGIIHRDLKPANIFLTKTEEPKLVDFGLAKDVSQQNQKLTQSGTILGTPLYMAPEQAQGEVRLIGKSSDVYSIGACLYQALTKRCPFEGATIHELFYKITSEEAKAPSSLNPKIHGDLDTIILKSLHKEPLRRYRTAKAFEEDLERFLAGFPVLARPAGKIEKTRKWIKRNRKLFFLSAPFLFILLVILGYFLWEQAEKKATRIRLYLEEAKIQEEKAHKIASYSKQGRVLRIQELMKANNTLNLVLSIDATNEISVSKKLAISKELIELACKNQEYQFANYILSELKKITAVEEEKKEQLKQYIFQSRNKISQKHEERFQYWLDFFQEHGVKEKRLEDCALLEISKMPEEKIFKRLLDLLEEGTAYYLQDKERSEKKDQYYKVLVRALGWLENPKASAPLYQTLERLHSKVLRYSSNKTPISEIRFMIVLAQALSYSKPNKNILQKLNTLRFKMPSGGVFVAQTQFIAKKFKFDLERQNIHFKNPNEKNLYEAELRESQKKYAEALEYLDKIILSDPNNVNAYFKRGKNYYRIRKYKKALEDCNKVIRFNSTLVEEAYLLRGVIKRDLNQIDGAIADFNEVIKRKKDRVDAYFNRGALWLAKGEFERGIKDYNKTLELNPNHYEAYRGRGYAKEQLGNFEGAIKDYDIAITINSKYSLAYSSRSYAKLRTDDTHGALQDCEEALRLDPHNKTAYYNRATAKLKLRDLKGALQDFDWIIKHYPTSASYFLSRAKVKYLLEDYHGAILDYEKATLLDPKLTEAYFSGAVLLSKLGDFKKAIWNYSRVIELEPKNVRGYRSRGRLKEKLKEYQSALQDFEIALKLAPNDHQTLNHIAVTKQLLGDFKGALLYFSKAISKSPKYYQYYYNRANIKKILKDYKGAITDYSNAIILEPTVAQSYFERGKILLTYGGLPAKKKAEQDFSHYLKLTQGINTKEMKRLRQEIWKIFPDLKRK